MINVDLLGCVPQNIACTLRLTGIMAGLTGIILGLSVFRSLQQFTHKSIDVSSHWAIRICDWILSMENVPD